MPLTLRITKLESLSLAKFFSLYQYMQVLHLSYCQMLGWAENACQRLTLKLLVRSDHNSIKYSIDFWCQCRNIFSVVTNKIS
jgi:hypothetical protein